MLLHIYIYKDYQKKYMYYGSIDFEIIAFKLNFYHFFQAFILKICDLNSS